MQAVFANEVELVGLLPPISGRLGGVDGLLLGRVVPQMLVCASSAGFCPPFSQRHYESNTRKSTPGLAFGKGQALFESCLVSLSEQQLDHLGLAGDVLGGGLDYQSGQGQRLGRLFRMGLTFSFFLSVNPSNSSLRFQSAEAKDFQLLHLSS